MTKSIFYDLGTYARLSLYHDGDYIGTFHDVDAREMEIYGGGYTCKAIHIAARGTDSTIYCMALSRRSYRIQYDDDPIAGGHELHVTEEH
jgi:hypothetical protein